MQLKIINKLANLYFLKSFAMDVAQARQILGLPENASKTDVMFAYKKQLHKLYMQTGQYAKVPALDEARDSLMQEPVVTKPVEPVIQQEQQDEKQESELLNAIKRKLDYSNLISPYGDKNYTFHIGYIDSGTRAHIGNSIEVESARVVKLIDKKIDDSNYLGGVIFSEIVMYNDRDDFKLCKVEYNFDTQMWYANFDWADKFKDMTWEEFKPILLKL